MKISVAILMGSDSDWPTMRAAAEVCGEFEVPFEARVVSAHRTPDRLYEYACHEGNYAEEHILSGARAMEREKRKEERQQRKAGRSGAPGVARAEG